MGITNPIKKSKLGHWWVTDEEMYHIQSHIEDLMHIPTRYTYGKIYDKVKNGEINKTQFKNLCIYFFEDSN